MSSSKYINQQNSEFAGYHPDDESWMNNPTGLSFPDASLMAAAAAVGYGNFGYAPEANMLGLDAQGETFPGAIPTNFYAFGAESVPLHLITDQTIANSFGMLGTSPSGSSSSQNGYSSTSPNSMDLQQGFPGPANPTEFSLDDYNPAFNGGSVSKGHSSLGVVGISYPTEGKKMCLKCLAQQKGACKGDGEMCDNCLKPGAIGKAWNPKYCYNLCPDSSIERRYIFDFGCQAEISSIFLRLRASGHQFTSEEAMLSRYHDVYDELQKRRNLMRLKVRIPSTRWFQIPSHDGDRMVLFHAAIKYLHETSSYIENSQAVTDDQIHDLLLVAAERRRAGHNMLDMLHKAVHSVFKGNKQADRAPVRSDLFEALTCLHSYLHHPIFTSQQGVLSNGKDLAYVLERLFVIITDKIAADIGSLTVEFQRDNKQAARLRSDIEQLY